MPQVKYIAEGSKLDSIRGVGLYWAPGQVRNVTAEVAERLTFYSDTWVAVEGEVPDTDPIGLTTEGKVAEEPLPVINFHAMDKKSLVEFAEVKYNERLDKRRSEETLRHEVIALFSKHEMELG